MKKTGIFMLICIFMSSHLIGCNLFKPKEDNWKPVKPQKKAIVHVVKYSGETLDIISKWYTGYTKNKTNLAEANPSISPNQLLAGDKIFIPNEILKTRTAMPKEFVDAYIAKQKKKAASSKSKKAKTKKKKKKSPPKKEKKKVKPKPEPPTEEEEFELFGPK